MIVPTVFPRSNAAATIYFITRFTAATIRGRPLIEGGVYHICMNYATVFIYFVVQFGAATI